MARRILLADDSITIQKVVELTFSEGDYEVLSVSNGQQAIQKIPEWGPDIALLDVIMPEKSGYEVCHEIKKDPRHQHLPVLLLTGTFEPFDADRAEQSGANGHITKPFESRALVAKVEELLADRPAPAPPVEAPEAARTEGGNGRQGEPEETPDWVAGDFGQDAGVDPLEGLPRPIPSGSASTPAGSRLEVPDPSGEPFPGRGGASRPAFPADPGFPTAGTTAPPEEDNDLGQTMRIELPDLTPEPFGENASAADPGSPEGFPYRSRPETEFPADPLGETAPPRPPMPSAPEPTDPALAGLETPLPDPEPERPSWSPTPRSSPGAAGTGLDLSPETIDAIARRVVEKLSDQIIREIAWEVVPDLAETLIRKRIQELEQQAGDD